MLTADVVRGLLDQLRNADDFEGGSDALLEALYARLAEPLGERGAQVVHGSVHLRSESAGYRALISRSWPADEASLAEPSASVFELLSEREAGLAIDLGTGAGIVIGDGAPIQLTIAPTSHDATGSVQAMLARDVTHLLALPLIAGGGLTGMVSMELAWPSQLAIPLAREAIFETAEALVLVAAPLLVTLPLARPVTAAEEAVDPLFPVIGAQTRPLFRVLERFVTQSETLLLSGPTGVGKSRLAEWCHAHSGRTGPFETANLLAVPEAMQMAELFGWRRGAFTGAISDHEGLVASADRGTLFLDEIDKLTLAAQAGLLRLLETRRFTPLGAAKERDVDVRFVVATNVDLRELVSQGHFREDLYYRVNVLPVRLEPLANRMDEVPRWADVMLARRHREAGGSGAAGFDEEAHALLLEATWPGNLRQLDNVVRRAYALGMASAERADGSLRVGSEAVRRALELDAPRSAVGDHAAAVEFLRALGDTLVENALALRRKGSTLTLDSLDVLRGSALRAAVERLGSPKDAFLLFGADALVESRNHHSAYRRELAGLEALERLLEAGD